VLISVEYYVEVAVSQKTITILTWWKRCFIFFRWLAICALLWFCRRRCHRYIHVCLFVCNNCISLLFYDFCPVKVWTLFIICPEFFAPLFFIPFFFYNNNYKYMICKLVFDMLWSSLGILYFTLTAEEMNY